MAGIVTSRDFRRNVMTLCFALTVGAGFISGGMAFWGSVPSLLRYGGPTFSDETKAALATIATVVPNEAPLFFVRPDPDPNRWVSRVWQRALYPHPVFLVTSADYLRSWDYLSLKSRYRVTHAVSMGAPPIDPGFALRQNVGSVGAEFVLFGPLKP